MRVLSSSIALAAAVAPGLPFSGSVRAQGFVENTTATPQGAPWNNSYSENISFVDIDLDGDLDM